MSNILSFENVSSGYTEIKVLDNLSFDVIEGEVFGVIDLMVVARQPC